MINDIFSVNYNPKNWRRCKPLQFFFFLADFDFGKTPPAVIALNIDYLLENSAINQHLLQWTTAQDRIVCIINVLWASLGTTLR